MAPISQAPEEFEYIVIGGGSGGSGTVLLPPLLPFPKIPRCFVERGEEAGLMNVGQESRGLVWQEDAFD